MDEELFSWTLAASPLDVNAFRIRQFNAILLPWGLLASSLQAQQGVPRYVQEGGLGFVISHEILHSLDTGGRGFDLQGKLAALDWRTTHSGCKARKSVKSTIMKLSLSLQQGFYF